MREKPREDGAEEDGVVFSAHERKRVSLEFVVMVVTTDPPHRRRRKLLSM